MGKQMTQPLAPLTHQPLRSQVLASIKKQPHACRHPCLGGQAAGMALALNNIKGISHQGRYEQGERKATWTGTLQLPRACF